VRLWAFAPVVCHGCHRASLILLQSLHSAFLEEKSLKITFGCATLLALAIATLLTIVASQVLPARYGNAGSPASLMGVVGCVGFFGTLWLVDKWNAKHGHKGDHEGAGYDSRTEGRD
jgi:hypothetical protein